jgi:hypothetical protein
MGISFDSSGSRVTVAATAAPFSELTLPLKSLGPFGSNPFLKKEPSISLPSPLQSKDVR